MENSIRLLVQQITQALRVSFHRPLFKGGLGGVALTTLFTERWRILPALRSQVRLVNAVRPPHGALQVQRLDLHRATKVSQ
jgi:hypothetical protein